MSYSICLSIVVYIFKSYNGWEYTIILLISWNIKDWFHLTVNKFENKEIVTRALHYMFKYLKTKPFKMWAVILKFTVIKQIIK